MKRVVPYEKKVETKKGVVLLNQACSYINEHLNVLGVDDYRNLTELCLYLLTGLKRKDINSTFFETVLDYVKENIGKMEIDFSEIGVIRQIRLGNIKMGSLTCKDFSLKEKNNRIEKKLNCCGFYPTMDRKERMFLTLNGNLIMGNQAAIKSTDYDNIYIGNYYFNRNTISPSMAALTKLEVISDESIVETICTYDESGEVEHYEGFISLEKHKNNEYFIVSLIDKKELFANRYGIAPSKTSSLITK